MKSKWTKKLLAAILSISMLGQIGLPLVGVGIATGDVEYTYDISKGAITIGPGTNNGLKVTHSDETEVYVEDKNQMLILTGTSTGPGIIITGGVTANITFDKLNIQGEHTVNIEKKSTVDLTLVGDNVLTNTSIYKAGLGVGEGNTLNITAASSGSSLTASASNKDGRGAGIGGAGGADGADGGTCGTIKISGGTITTKSYYVDGTGIGVGGAGIGGGKG